MIYPLGTVVYNEQIFQVNSLYKRNKFVQLKSDVASEWEEAYLGTITEEEEEKPRRRTKRPSVAQ